MKTLVQELKDNYGPILEELKQRAHKELQGTLYEVLEQQKVLSARYDNVVEVIIDYLQDGDKAMLIQHHIIMFMQRYYVRVDAEHPLTSEIIDLHAEEIDRAVGIYFDVWKNHTSPNYHGKLDEMYNIIREIIGQANEFLKKRLSSLSTRLPLIKLRDIDYEPGSQFDIDPQLWPQS